MKQTVSKIVSRLVLVALIIVLLPILFPSAGYLLGYCDARYHSLNGEYRIKALAVGQPKYWPEFCRLLKVKYNVTLESGGSCIGGSWSERYAAGFNAVAFKSLRQKYGRSVFSECHDMALKQWLLSKAADERERQEIESRFNIGHN
jgi:hypothetical protein